MGKVLTVVLILVVVCLISIVFMYQSDQIFYLSHRVSWL